VAAPCDATAAPAEFPVTRFKLAETSFFFSTVLGFFDCSEGLADTGEELDEDGCSTALSLEFSSLENDETVSVQSCSCSGETCAIGDLSGVWEETADGVSITSDRSSADVPNPSTDPNADCDPTGLVDAHRADLICDEREHIEGTRE
jgi:hypothetical protein